MKLNCFILRTTAVAGLGVPIFRVITVNGLNQIWTFKKVFVYRLKLCVQENFGKFSM